MKPQKLEALIARGLECLRARQLDEALQHFQKVLSAQPKHFDALQLSGLVFKQAGHHEEALRYFEAALAINRKAVAVQLNRANTLKELGRNDEALEGYDRTIALKRDHPQAHFNRALLHLAASRFQEATDDFDRAILYKPDFYQAYNSRGVALKSMAKHDEAIASYEKAISLHPDYPEALNNLGVAYQALSQSPQALEALNRALELRKSYPEALNHRGVVHQFLKQYDAAIADYEQALSYRPNYPEAWQHLGNLFQTIKRLDDAVRCYEKAYQLAPHQPYLLGALLHTRMHLCQWGNFDEYLATLTQAILADEPGCLPFPLLALVDDPQLHLRCARQYSALRFASDLHGHSAFVERQGSAHREASASFNRRSRIGYFSADFHDHATLHLMLDVFKHHDRSRYEIFAYSFGPVTDDPWQQSLRGHVDHWIDISFCSDQWAAQHARDAGIDIAVDVKGHTQGARSGIFARRAAPIQVNYLGYPGSMGAPWIDYVIGDPVVVPKGVEEYYQEQVLRMPLCYQPNMTEREVEGVSDRDGGIDGSSNNDSGAGSNRGGDNYTGAGSTQRLTHGLNPDSFIYCSFNNSYKITPLMFASWMRILKAVPNSQLWLLITHQTARLALKARASEHGVDAQRLIFADYLPVQAHLARLRSADLCLDSFPYSAHTTASDALRMGLPVLTRQGESFASRVASSLLHALDMNDLICTTQTDYEARAISLGLDPNAYTLIKQRLLQNKAKSELFNARAYTRDLESIYAKLLAIC